MQIAHILLASMLDALESDPALAARARRVLGLDGADDELVTIDRAAEIAGTTPGVIREQARQKKIDLVGPPRRRRVRRAELVRWMTECPAMAAPAESGPRSAIERAAKRMRRSA